MRRRGRILAFVLVLLVACYSAAWWVAADQSRALLLENMNKPDSAMQLGAERVELSGYPFHIGLDLHHAQVKTPTFDARAEEIVTLERTITGSEYRIVLPRVLHFIENGVARDCEYKSKPSLALKVNPFTLERQMLFKGPESLEALLQDPKMIEAFRSIHYQDEGSHCVTEQGIEQTSNEGAEIRVSASKGEKGRKLSVEGKVKAPKIIQPNIVLDMAAVNLEFDIDGVDSLRGNAAKDAVLDVHSFLLDAGDFSLNLTGHVEWNETSPLPYGTLNLILANFPKLIDMSQKRFATLPKEESAKVPAINQAKLVALIEKLGKVAPGTKDATIVIARLKEGAVTFGDMGMQQLLMELYAVREMPEIDPESQEEKVEVPESDDVVTDTVMPTPKL